MPDPKIEPKPPTGVVLGGLLAPIAGIPEFVVPGDGIPEPFSIASSLGLARCHSWRSATRNHRAGVTHIHGFVDSNEVALVLQSDTPQRDFDPIPGTLQALVLMSAKPGSERGCELLVPRVYCHVQDSRRNTIGLLTERIHGPSVVELAMRGEELKQLHSAIDIYFRELAARGVHVIDLDPENLRVKKGTWLHEGPRQLAEGMYFKDLTALSATHILIQEEPSSSAVPEPTPRKGDPRRLAVVSAETNAKHAATAIGEESTRQMIELVYLRYARMLLAAHAFDIPVKGWKIDVTPQEGSSEASVQVELESGFVDGPIVPYIQGIDSRDQTLLYLLSECVGVRQDQKDKLREVMVAVLQAKFIEGESNPVVDFTLGIDQRVSAVLEKNVAPQQIADFALKLLGALEQSYAGLEQETRAVIDLLKEKPIHDVQPQALLDLAIEKVSGNFPATSIALDLGIDEMIRREFGDAAQ